MQPAGCTPVAIWLRCRTHIDRATALFMFKNVAIVLGPILGMVLLLALLLPEERAHGDGPLLKIDIRSDDKDDGDAEPMLAGADLDEREQREVERAHREMERAHREIERATREIERKFGPDFAERIEEKVEKALEKADWTEALRNLDFKLDIDAGDDNDDDRGGFSANIGSGKVILVAGTSQNSSRECGEDTKVAVLGNSNHVTLTGKCAAVAATGNSNFVTVEHAEKVAVIGNSNVVKVDKVGKVYFRGNSNRVDYSESLHGDSPTNDAAGNNNVLARK